MLPRSNGSEGCKCINATKILSSLNERSCEFTTADSDVQNGVLLAANPGTCVPLFYGSNECLQHDILYDNRCKIGLETGRVLPYCVNSWCYVDRESCKLSNETLYRSNNFPSKEANLFYSYTTCNSTADAWLNYVNEQSEEVLGGVSIDVGVPSLEVPIYYKTSDSGSIVGEVGKEYFDDSIQFEGIYTEYMENLRRIAGDDIGNVNYTHGSIGSRLSNPWSSYTALVEDIENGIVDMGIGPFWVTEERLQKTAFTVPIGYDQTFLVVPKPGSTYSLQYESAKVFGPFTPEMWVTILFIIIVSALLSVWFSYQSRANLKETKTKKYMAWCRLSLDAVLQKGMFFFAQGVEQDPGANLPHKLLMFGFGFFILISVSCYVANLAAFLTMDDAMESITTMEQAVTSNVKICAHPVMESLLKSKWPDAHFVSVGVNDWFEKVFDFYEAKECPVLAIGKIDSQLNTVFRKRLCENGLVFTDSIIVETPMAFPVRSDLASGVSYWMHHLEKHHAITVMKAYEEYVDKQSRGSNCVFHLSETKQEVTDDFAQISPANMILPILFFAVFAAIAILLHIYHSFMQKRGRGATWVGRTSSLGFTFESTMNHKIAKRDEFSQEQNKDVGVINNADRESMSDDSFFENEKGVAFHGVSASEQKSVNGSPQEFPTDQAKEA